MSQSYSKWPVHRHHSKVPFRWTLILCLLESAGTFYTYTLHVIKSPACTCQGLLVSLYHLQDPT